MQQKSSEVRELIEKDSGHIFMDHIMTEEQRKMVLPEFTDNQKFRAYGSVYEYHDRFKQILKRYLTMKYTQKKEYREISFRAKQ